MLRRLPSLCSVSARRCWPTLALPTALYQQRIAASSTTMAPKRAASAEAEPSRAEKAAAAATLDTSDFKKLGEDMAAYDARRETIIKQSRDIGKLSKQAIFSLHRGNDEEAVQRLDKAARGARELEPLVSAEPDLRYGSFAAAMEEFAEAKLFRCFLQEGRLMTSIELPTCSRDEYLGGVLDFTGELNRYAVARATERNTEAVRACRELVEGIFGEFLQYDLRNGAIRKKFDALKYTQKKLETLLYELSLANAGVKTHQDVAGNEPREEAAAMQD